MRISLGLYQSPLVTLSPHYSPLRTHFSFCSKTLDAGRNLEHGTASKSKWHSGRSRSRLQKWAIGILMWIWILCARTFGDNYRNRELKNRKIANQIIDHMRTMIA